MKVATTADQRRTARRVQRLLDAARGADWLATMTTGTAPALLARRARELRDEHRDEMREAIRVVAAHVDERARSTMRAETEREATSV
jgi:hypothetical protein